MSKELETSENPSEGLGNFFDYLWGDVQGYVYLPTKNGKTDEWKKTLFEWPAHRPHIIKHVLAKNAEGLDVYVAPAIFDAAKPTKDHVKGSNVVWVDFDGNAPTSWDAPEPSEAGSGPGRGLPVPSLRITSSKAQHEHVYWRLEEFCTDIEFIENINRSLAYRLKADTSGWDVGQVLRPPHTSNYKAKPVPVVIEATTEHEYTRQAFAGFERVKQVVPENIEITELVDVRKVIAKYTWDDHHFELFTKDQIEEGKRSSALMALGFFGAEKGMSDNEIYSLLINADDRWGKFKNRSDRTKRLLDIINRARHKYPVGEQFELRGLLGSADEVELGTKIVYGFDEFNKLHLPINWVIKDLLEERGMGMVVSAPGVGKTQLSLQMGACMALGKPFLGWEIERKIKTLWFSLEMNPAALQWFTSKMTGAFTEAQMQELDRNLMMVPMGETLSLDNADGQRFFEALLDEFKPEVLIIDSMGKVTMGSLSEETKAKQLNDYYAKIRKRYGLSFWFIHHNRKANGDNKKPKELADVYGNQYISADVSSAINLWKNEDGTLELSSIKTRLSQERPAFQIERNEHLMYDIVEKPVGEALISNVSREDQKKDDGLFGM